MTPNSNSSIAGQLNIQCRKGDTFTREMTFTDADGNALDLSGYTIILTVKNTSGTTITTFSGGDVTGTPASGIVIFSKTAAQMAALAAGEYVYDVQATDDPAVITYLSGKFIIDSDISA